jgi:ornithine carbamoyltransferase
MPKKDLLSLLDYTPETIAGLISSARQLKAGRLKNDPRVFAGKTGVLLFEKPSLRTRITFETAINELGGHAINLAPDSVQMGRRESVADVGRNLERWVHLLVVRTFSHDIITKLAASCAVPIINALTDSDHPCQALAFGLTLQEYTGTDHGQTIVFVGDGNNVCHALMILAAKLGHNFIAACPPGYTPRSEITAACVAAAKQHGCTCEIMHDPGSAVARATVIYTDVWASMGQENEAAQRKNTFAQFQVNEALVARAPADVFISHCLPAHRGEEITSQVLDSSRCFALDEAENRLHVQKAVIAHLFS